ncbi:MAG: hypothetical protein IKX57_05205 [Oscillospiraceae bacterium]|nr:hypothetical protein [Oscillospiraceae bacterium]
MGHGSYTASDWNKLRSSFGAQKKASDIFRAEAPQTAASLRGVFREARDNEDSPMSTPVIIGLDVTASMGYLAEELATHALNRAIMYLYENKPIPCPQVLCCAIGDSKSDRVPLQVTQFESDIRIIKQLTGLYLEGGGGGNGGESYQLAWYFAANRTKTDCYKKRHRKGHLITIGDDLCHKTLTRNEIARVFGDSVPYDLSDSELLAAAEEKYHVFHICIDKGMPGDDRIFAAWNDLMPGRVAAVSKKDISCLAELIFSLISVAEGKTNNEALRCVDQSAAEIAAASLACIRMADQNIISF